MISANGKKLNEINDMGVCLIKHPASNLIELWINNVFICQGENMYINHSIEDQACITTYYPDDEEELPFN